MRYLALLAVPVAGATSVLTGKVCTDDKFDWNVGSPSDCGGGIKTTCGAKTGAACKALLEALCSGTAAENPKKAGDADMTEVECKAAMVKAELAYTATTDTTAFMGHVDKLISDSATAFTHFTTDAGANGDAKFKLLYVANAALAAHSLQGIKTGAGDGAAKVCAGLTGMGYGGATATAADFTLCSHALTKAALMKWVGEKFLVDVATAIAGTDKKYGNCGTASCTDGKTTCDAFGNFATIVYADADKCKGAVDAAVTTATAKVGIDASIKKCEDKKDDTSCAVKSMKKTLTATLTIPDKGIPARRALAAVTKAQAKEAFEVALAGSIEKQFCDVVFSVEGYTPFTKILDCVPHNTEAKLKPNAKSKAGANKEEVTANHVATWGKDDKTVKLVANLELAQPKWAHEKSKAVTGLDDKLGGDKLKAAVETDIKVSLKRALTASAADAWGAGFDVDAATYTAKGEAAKDTPTSSARGVLAVSVLGVISLLA